MYFGFCSGHLRAAGFTSGFYNNLCHLVICPADTLEVVSANGPVGGGMTRAFDGLFAGLVKV